MNSREIPSSSRGPKWLLDLFKSFRLAWHLLRDPSVPIGFKLIPLGALLYVLFPADFIPDLVPVLGQMDDLTVILLGLKLFIDACPPITVEKHRAQMSSVEASYRVVEDEQPQAGNISGYLDVAEPSEHQDEVPASTPEQLPQDSEPSA